MPLTSHGRSRRRLRVLPPEEEEDEDPPLMGLGDRMAGLPPQHRDSGGMSADVNAGGPGSASDSRSERSRANTPGGDGAPRLQLERVEMTRERPQLDEEALQRNRWLTLASAGLSGLGALADSPQLAKVGAGLTEGFSQSRARRLDRFYDELTSFRDRRQEVQEQNTRLTNEERRANFDRDLEDLRRRYEERVDELRRDLGREPSPTEKMQARAELLEGRATYLRALNESGGDGAPQSGGDAQENGDNAAVPGFEAVPVRKKDGTWRVWEMRDGEPVDAIDVESKEQARQLARDLNGQATQPAPDSSGGGSQRRGPAPTGRQVPTDTSDTDTSAAPAGGRTPAEDESLMDDATPVRHRGSDMEHTEEQPAGGIESDEAHEEKLMGTQAPTAAETAAERSRRAREMAGQTRAEDDPLATVAGRDSVSGADALTVADQLTQRMPLPDALAAIERGVQSGRLSEQVANQLLDALGIE